MIPLTSFAPDANPLTPGILIDADGIYPTDKGIAGLPEAVSLSDALISDCLGVISFRQLDGSIRTIAGTATNLFEITGSAWTDVSRMAGYTGTNGYRWRFAPWGNYILAVNGTDAYQVSTGGDFDDVGAYLPIAKYITTSNNYVVMAHCLDYEGSTYRHRVCWSAQGDYSNFTPSLSTQSGYVDLVDIPGEITGLAKIGNAIVVFKEQGLYLGSYVGPPYVWSFERIQGYSGTVSQEAVIELEAGLLYYGMDDFYLFDGSVPRRIGEAVNTWFINRVNRQYWSNILGAYDPFRRLAFWYFPTEENGSGDCVDCLIFDWQRGNWGRKQIAVQAALVHYRAGVIYDTIPNHFATYDDINLIYNDPFWSSYSFDSGVINSEKKLCRYTGSPEKITFTTGDSSDNNNLIRTQSIRPMFSTYTPTCYITPITRDFMGDTGKYWQTGNLRYDKVDLRATGRYTRFAWEITGNFELTGYDIVSKIVSRR